ncbi:unnamed protein product [Calypogeia fissa]
MRTSTLAVVLVALVGALGFLNSPVPVLAQPGIMKVLNFFMHDHLLTATNASAFIIVQPLASGANQSSFGTLVVFDDSITVSPDASSLEIGRGQGFYLFAENTIDTPGIEYSWTAEFTGGSGFTPGSTLVFKGLDRVRDPVREIAVVGGTGDFRMARGWAVVTTYSFIGIGDSILNITAYYQCGF